MKNNVMVSPFDFGKLSTQVFTALAIAFSFSVSANAQTATPSGNSARQDRVPAIVYLPDVQLQELAPQSIVVTPNQPVRDAVGKILQAYQGQDLGIRGYEVKINPSTQSATINFIINDPQGAEVFDRMSSANQYALFEAIRQTLLSQSVYHIQKVNFTANGQPFDI